MAWSPWSLRQSVWHQPIIFQWGWGHRCMPIPLYHIFFSIDFLWFLPQLRHTAPQLRHLSDKWIICCYFHFSLLNLLSAQRGGKCEPITYYIWSAMPDFSGNSFFNVYFQQTITFSSLDNCIGDVTQCSIGSLPKSTCCNHTIQQN